MKFSVYNDSLSIDIRYSWYTVNAVCLKTRRASGQHMCVQQTLYALVNFVLWNVIKV